MSSEDRPKFVASTSRNVGENEPTIRSTSSLPQEGSIANITSTNGELHLSSKPVESIANLSPANADQKQNANIGKRVIRKVMVIDPKKLQQAGLDRKLAEAIGRQKLKTLALEQKEKPQKSDTNVLSAACGTNPIGNTKVIGASTKATTPTTITPTTKETTYMQSTNASSTVTKTPTTVIKTIPTTETFTRVAAIPVITKVQSLKNVNLKSPYQEPSTLSKGTKDIFIQKTSNVTETKLPASIKKLFVTPKITITRPVEASSSLHIVPQQRLENVKYILQCKILKKQQQTAQAHQATQTFQFPGATTSSSLFNPTRIIQSPAVEPKIEEPTDFMRITKGKLPKKPSPVKTPQDIARVLDFGSDAKPICSPPSFAAISNNKEIKKNLYNDALHIRNSGISTPKDSPKKLETVNAYSRDVARLIARIGTIDHQHDKAYTDPTVLEKIPKATIKCEKIIKEGTNKKVASRKERITKKNVTSGNHESVIKQEIVTQDLNTNSVIIQPATINQTIKLPMLQKDYNETGKIPNTKQSTDLTHFKDFPIFSPLKQPFPVVTHSQDLPLPTISTFKTPFPTSLIRIGQMPQPQTCTNTTCAQKSLIVLENKVLTQDEKIDLTGLGLATPKMETPSKMDFTGLGLATPKIETPAKNDLTGLGLATPKIETPAKNDLTGLGLATPKIETTRNILNTYEDKSLEATTAHKVTNEINQGDMATSTKFGIKYTPTDGAKINNRTILSMDKIKLSAEQISSLVKAINAKKPNSPKKYVVFGNIKNIQKQSEQTGELSKINKDISSRRVPNNSNATVGNHNTSTSLNPNSLLNQTDEVAKISKISFPKENRTVVLNNNQQEHSPSSSSKNKLIMPSTVDSRLLPHKSEVQSPEDISINHSDTLYIERTSEITSTYSMPPKTEVLSDSGSQSDTEVQFKNPLPRITQNVSNIDNFGYSKSGAYVIDSGEESDASISAVDFIASLAAEHPITAETKLELSPEELNLNASFSMNFSPLRIPNRDRTDSIKSEIMEQEIYEAVNTTDTKIPTELFTSQVVPEDVQIGKIITISEENIIKAVNASNPIEHMETDKKHDTIKRQGAFQRTERNNKYAETTQQESKVDNTGIVNNLDIIKTEGISGSSVSPIEVKNYEFGLINNIEEPQMSPVIVQNLESSVHFAKLSETKGNFNTAAGKEHLNMRSIKTEINVAGVSIKNMNKFENAVVPANTSSSNANEKIQLEDFKSEFEATEKVLETASGIHPLAEVNVSAVGQPTASGGEILKIENTPVESLTEPSISSERYRNPTIENNEQRQKINVEEINDANEKSSPASEDNSSAATKRLPRLKKGKVNLVTRRKIVAAVQEVKKVSPNVSENVETEVTHKKSTEEINLIREEDATPNTGNDEIYKEFEKECNSESSNLVKAVKEDNQNSSKQLVEVVENNNSTVILAKQATCDFSTCDEPLLRSSELKRTTAEISELLHPPKIPKRKSLSIGKEPVEEKMENILVAAVTAATQEIGHAPPQIPFKKHKIEAYVDEKSVKGIHNLKAKFIKGGHSKENDAALEEKKMGERDSTAQMINTEINLDKPQNVDELDRENLKTSNAESAIASPTFIVEKPHRVNEIIDKLPISNAETEIKNQTVTDKNSQQVNENISEQNLMQTLPPITENKTEGQLSNLLGPQTKSETLVEEQRLGLNNSENVKPSEPQKSFVYCDNVNVIAVERITEENNEGNVSTAQTRTIQNNEENEKLKSDFHGFDQGSPSTQNIESNLQHLITITTSAEKTNTREENFSTSERESPHTAKGKRPTKSWLSSPNKATPNKSKSSMDRRKSTSRRSVPLKKRWEVLRKSEDDLEISDDLTPVDDDDEDVVGKETNKAGSLAMITSAEKSNIDDTDKKGKADMECKVGKEVAHDIVEECEKENPTKPIENKSSIIQLKTCSTVGLKRSRASDDDKGEKELLVAETDPNTEINSILESENPNKRIRMDHNSKNVSASTTNATKSKMHSAVKATNLTAMMKQDADEINTQAEGASFSNTLMQDNQITENKILKPKAKRVRKAKTKIVHNKFNETLLEAETTEVTDAHHSLSVIESANKKEENTQDLAREQKTSKKGRRRQKCGKQVEEATTDNINQPETDQTKSVQKSGGRARKTKVNVDDSTLEEESSRSKFSDLELGAAFLEVAVKEEYVAITKELVVPSLSEMEIILEANKKTGAASSSKGAEIKPNLEKSLEFTTSTPTSKPPKAKKSKELKNKGKPLGDIVVDLAENKKTKESGESKPVVGKKRGRKPKANITEPLEASITVSIESENTNSNKNNTTATDVSLNVSQMTGEPEAPIKVPKKRGRKPKVITETPEDAAKPKRSRGVDLEARGNFNERLLLITNRAQLETDEVLTAEPMASTSKTQSIQCGLCLQQMNREMWLHHLATHYGVGWIVGETPAINVTIRNEVLKAMMAFLKDNEGKYPLTCRMCKRTYRSGLGTLLHIEMCGEKDNRQKCDYCNQEYSKYSIATHMRICIQRMANKREEMQQGENEQKEAVFNNVGRRKRVSVQKAEKIIKAIGNDIKTTGIYYIKEAKHYIKFVPTTDDTENIAHKWKSDLETLGKADCPAPNCTFETKDVAAMQSHLEKCELKETIPKTGVYICKLCDNTTNKSDTYSNAKQAMKHVLQEHKNTENAPDFEADASDCDIKTDDEISDDDDMSSGVDSDEENDNWSVHTNEDDDVEEHWKRRRRHAIVSQDVPERLHPPREFDYSRTAMRLWAEFTSEQYSSQPLFTDIKVNYNICARPDYEPYLPQWESSIKFHFDSKLNVTQLERNMVYGKGRKDINWSQLQRFEITEKKNEQFVFIGEAIKLLHWVPLPSNIDEQYLLISTRREYTRTKNPKIANTLLWLYKVIPPIQFKSFSMQLHYAINIPEGPVHCMAFLPSGGYDANANRLGLVAIGTPKSTIKIYALPLSIEGDMPNESAKEHSEDVPKDFTVINLQPVWQLTLDVSNNDLSSHPLVDTQCKVLCWSEFSGHAYIFAGYSNGCISYWDITYEMNLNRFIIDGLPNYVPVNFFYTGDRNIHAMALHYDSSGIRLLAVALSRRLLYIYDFKRFERPFLLKNEVARNEVTDLEWSPLWQSVGIAISDALPFDGNTIYAMNPTNIEFKNETIERLNGNITQIKYNPVQHVLSTSTENGDFVILNIREMHLKEIMREAKFCDRAAAIMEVKRLDGNDLPQDDPKNRPSDWSFFEENTTEKYGVVFGPLARMSIKHRAQYRKANRRPPLNLRHCTRINSLRCNTNTAGKKLFALGYENGFVRILNIDRKLYFD